MEFLTRDQIDPIRWNQRIQNSSIENVFCYSWYLDAICETWGGLVTDNYSTILPVVYNSKLGVKKCYQPIYTREFDLFGADFTWTASLEYLTHNFKQVSFRNEAENLQIENVNCRKNQILDLTAYSPTELKSTTRQLIKKANGKFIYELHDDPSVLSDLFESTSAKRIQEIKKREITYLNQLMQNALAVEKGELITAKTLDERIVAGCFFLKDKSRITLLKSASLPEFKKSGVMYGLLNHAITRYQNAYATFDFGGSEIESIANFFKKFGATDRNYYNYTIDNTPFWYTALLRLKGSYKNE